MTESSPQPTQQFRGKLTRATLLLLLPITIIPIAFLGSIILFNTTNFLREQVILQFNNVAQTQVQQINAQVEDSQTLLQQLEDDTLFNEALDRVLSSELDSSEWQVARDELLADYERVSNAQTRHIFDNLAVVTTENEIIASTNPLLEENLIDPDTFGALLFGSTSILFYDNYQFTDDITDRLLMVSSFHMDDVIGDQKAILLGITGSEEFEQILEIGKLSHPQARPYFISNSELGDVFVGLSPTTGEITAFNPSMDHIEMLMPKVQAQEIASVVEFESFDDIPVLGFTNWVDSIKAPIVLEIPQTAISEPIQGSLFSQIALLAIMIIILGLIIWQGTRRIVRPIEEVSTTARKFADGELQARAVVNRKDEIGLLAYSFNYLADQLVSLYQSMESSVESQTQQIQAASEIAQVVTSATSLDEMLSHSVNLINQRFNYYYTAIFLMNRGGDILVLREAAGEAAHDQLSHGLQIAVGSRSIIGNVAASNNPWIANDVRQDYYYLELETLPDTQSEAAIPLSIGGRVLGVLDVQRNELKAFDDQDIATLQTLARQIASAIQNVRLLEITQIDLQSANLLYQTSHRLANAETINGILLILAEILQQVPFISRVFSLESGKLQTVDLALGSGSINNIEASIPISKEEINHILAEQSWEAIKIDDPPHWVPNNLLGLAKKIGCLEFVLIPLNTREQLPGIIMLGSVRKKGLTPSNVELFNSIAQMTSTALAKIEASNRITASFAELQSLSALSQAISTETNLDYLFDILHRQVIQTLGDVNFLIALYDAATELIEIPFMTEGDQIVSIPPFPLGQGLTSIVIRTKQPLMIVEDTVNRSRALGAIVTSGKSAQSWLGVPLIVAGEAVGAMAVQDLENEHRFDEDDLRLLTTLAGQVAPTIRNVRLLAITQDAAERDRQLLAITNNIRRATSIPEILEMTTRELSQVLDLKRAKIEISTLGFESSDQDNGTEEILK